MEEPYQSRVVHTPKLACTYEALLPQRVLGIFLPNDADESPPPELAPPCVSSMMVLRFQQSTVPPEAQSSGGISGRDNLHTWGILIGMPLRASNLLTSACLKPRRTIRTSTVPLVEKLSTSLANGGGKFIRRRRPTSNHRSSSRRATKNRGMICANGALTWTQYTARA